ncbi:hypothetical protein AB4Y64_13105 [Lysobacter sp. TAF61]|uniref:hypothetical protein n=1 Tax=Lysobacter sp. TAF61 TaxID=3233072 RepID=UPI003F9E4F37
MNPAVELNLALILFLPWFAILGVLYWLFPRQPRHAARKLYDTVALLLAVTAFLLSIYWSHDHADPVYGRMWQQILATALGYGVFLAVLTVAFVVRNVWFRRTR